MTQVAGWADPTSMLVHTSAGTDQYNDALQALGIEPGEGNKVVRLTPETISGVTVDRLRRMDKPLLHRCLLTLCTHHHELEHIRQTACTTTGLRLVLARLRHLSAAGQTLRQYFSRRPGVRLRVPLLGSMGQAEELDRMIEDLLDFERATAGELGLTVYPMGELLKMYPKGMFSSSLASHLPSSPAGLTVNHLLEGAARYEEIRTLQYWRSLGADEEVVESLLRSLLQPAGYHEAWDYFVHSTQSIDDQISDRLQLWRMLLAIALWPDVLRGIPAAGLRWEDHQPCWRFAQLLFAVAEGGVPAQLDRAFVEELCEGVEIPSPFELAAAHIDAYGGHGLGHPIESDFMDRHLAYCRDLLSLPMALDPNGMSSTTLTAVLPWIQVNANRVDIRRLLKGGNARDTALTSTWIALNNAIVFTGDLQLVKELHRALIDALVHAGLLEPQDVEADFAHLVHMVAGCRPEQLQTAGMP